MAASSASNASATARPLASAWTGPRGDKCVPAGFQLDGAALRLWALAAGCALTVVLYLGMVWIAPKVGLTL